MDVRDRNDFCWPYTYVRWWPGGPTTRSNASMLLKIRSQWWVVSECMRYSTAHGVGMVYRVFLFLLSEIFYFRLTCSTIDSRNYSRDQPDNTHSFPSYASCSILHFPHTSSFLILSCPTLLAPPPSQMHLLAPSSSFLSNHNAPASLLPLLCQDFGAHDADEFQASTPRAFDIMHLLKIYIQQQHFLDEVHA